MGVSLAQKGTLVLGETKETLASQVRASLGVGAAGRPGGLGPTLCNHVCSSPTEGGATLCLPVPWGGRCGSCHPGEPRAGM